MYIRENTNEKVAQKTYLDKNTRARLIARLNFFLRIRCVKIRN